MQPLPLLSVEDGVQQVHSLLPVLHKVKTKDIKLRDVDKNVLTVSVPDVGDLKMSWAEGQSFKGRTGIDPTMLGRLSNDLKVRAFNELIGNAGDEMQFKTRDTTIVNISPAERNFPDYRVLLDRAVTFLEGSGQLKGFANIYSNRDKVGFGVVTSAVQTPPKKVNDVVHEGLYFGFNGEARVQPYNYRLVCSNGACAMRFELAQMVTPETFDVVMRGMVGKAELFTRSFVHLDERPAPQPGNLVGRLSRLRVLNNVQVAQIMQQVATLGGNATEFDLINLITAHQHGRSNDLSWLVAGGQAIAYLHDDHCPNCGGLTGSRHSHVSEAITSTAEAN